MRLAVIAHALRVGGGLSVGKNIIGSLGRVAPENQYLVTVPAGLGYEELCQKLPQAEFSVFRDSVKGLSRLRYELAELPRIVRRFRPDVVLGLGNAAVPAARCLQAILCHNAYLFYPLKHFGGRFALRAMLSTLPLQRWRVKRHLRASKLLLCQTEAAAERLRQCCDYSGRVMICPNAVSRFVLAPRHPPLPEQLLPSAGRMRLLYLTHYYPHKNLEILVETFRRFRSELRNVVVVITISGDQHPGAARVLRNIRRHELESSIVNVGPLKQEELAGYFSHCQALLMPTLLESFSGTYLEAMHFGLPILTSDLDFAHAVCGPAAIYFDPWNPGAIYDAIRRLQSQPQLARRLAAAGHNRLAGMHKSWDEIVAEICAALSHLVKEMESAGQRDCAPAPLGAGAAHRTRGRTLGSGAGRT